MTWIPLICCLLALSSPAFGRSAYGSYSSVPLTQASSMGAVRDLTSQQSSLLPQLPIQSGYGQQHQQPQTTSFLSGLTENVQQDTIRQPMPSTYGSSYGGQQFVRKPTLVQADQTVATSQSYGKPQFPVQQRTFPSPQQLLFEQQQRLQETIQQSQIVTEADVLCRGQRAETVIPLEGNRRYVVCLDDGKGHQQECPKGLFYHPESRRCERKLGPLENPCASQPCLNGGQCVATDASSYQCQCTPGYDGKTCELDATICQTQQPCGQSPDTRCQSFRSAAALQYICILQDGRAYGLTAQQAHPSPCRGVDGTQPLAFSDKGFIMCDGESMFIESCPGGTIWDDMNKACVWPDMQGVVGASFDQSPKIQGYGQQTSYGSIQRPMTVQREQFKVAPTSYDQSSMKTFGAQLFTEPKPTQFLQQADQRISSFEADRRTPSYGAETPIRLPQQQELIRLPQQDQIEQIQVPQQQFSTSSFGTQQPIMKPQIWQQPIQRQEDMRPMQRSAY